MTTFNYRIEIDESESLALEAALEQFIKVCENKLKSGEDWPRYISLKTRATSVLYKLKSNPIITSSNNFWDRRQTGGQNVPDDNHE